MFLLTVQVHHVVVKGLPTSLQPLSLHCTVYHVKGLPASLQPISLHCTGLPCEGAVGIFTAIISALYRFTMWRGCGHLYSHYLCTVQVYHVKGRFGWATSDFTPRGKIIERTSYRKYSCLCLLTVTIVLAYMSWWLTTTSVFHLCTCV